MDFGFRENVLYIDGNLGKYDQDDIVVKLLRKLSDAIDHNDIETVNDIFCSIDEIIRPCFKSDKQLEEYYNFVGTYLDFDELVEKTMFIWEQEKIEAHYSEESDMTFITREYKREITVIGFYFGEPDDEATKQFAGKLSCKF